MRWAVPKEVVLLCDDQKRFRDEFVKHHAAHYEIITLDDSMTVVDRVKQLKRLPDIVLLDLFHPRDNEPDFEERRLRAEEELERLDDQIEATNKAVLATWEPHGIEVLRNLREMYPVHELPIAIYTQKGMLLLTDDQLRLVEELDGHWLLKKKLSARTEKTRIDRLIAYDRKLGVTKEPNTRWHRLALAVSWLIIAVLVAVLVVDVSNFSDVALTVLGVVATALITYVVSKYLD
jgi:CheY-like chemotaxis protein